MNYLLVQMTSKLSSVCVLIDSMSFVIWSASFVLNGNESGPTIASFLD